MPDFEIRSLKTLAEFRAAEEVQRVAWQSAELDVVPLHLLLTVAKNGGVVLGAFTLASNHAGEELIGFVFGFLGTSEHRLGPEAPAAVKLKHCSHQMGVRPEWQSRGVGYALKVAQREAARTQGLRLITWTYDPLESKNAHLNILKLGAVCNTYLRDLYGELRDDLNRGLASDRFQVDWWIASNRVETRLTRRRQPLQRHHDLGAPLLNAITWDDNGLPVCADHVRPLDDVHALIEFPTDFQTVRRLDNRLAQAWRLQLRSICEDAFARSYSVIDYIYAAGPPARNFYLVQQFESNESALNV